jgi:hypothetical protein
LALRRGSTGLIPDREHRLFRLDDNSARPPYSSSYDVSVDGRGVLARVAKEDVRSRPLTVIFNPSIATAQ